MKRLFLAVLLLAPLTELAAQENVEPSENAGLVISLLIGGFFLYLGVNAIKRKGMPVSVSFYPTPTRPTEPPSDRNQEDPATPPRKRSGFLAYGWVVVGVVFSLFGGFLCAHAILKLALQLLNFH